MKLIAISVFALPGCSLAYFMIGRFHDREDQGLVYNFRHRRSSETVDHMFIWRNDTGRALTVTGIHPDCGCTTASLSSMQCAAGDSLHLNFRLPLGGLFGKVEKSVVLSTSDTEYPYHEFRMIGHVDSALSISPEAFSIRRNMDGTFENTSEILARTSTDEYDFKVLSVDSDSPAVHAFFEQLSGGSCRVTISPRGVLPFALRFFRVYIRTNLPHDREITLPVNVETFTQ
jgi:hypothetical protein